MYHEPEVKKGPTEYVVAEQWDRTTYVAECTCGWRGPTRLSPHEADYDCMEHRMVENEQ